MDLVIFAVVVLLWGSTFVAVKYCLRDWSVVQVVAGRYVLGALLLLPLALWALKEQGAVYKQHFGPIVHLALVGSVLPVGLMTWAQQSMPSSFAGVIASLAPMMALVAGVLFFGLATRPLHWLGVVLGSCGVAVLRGGGSVAGLETGAAATAPITGATLAAALLATACWGMAAQNYRRHLSGLNALHVTALSFQVMGFVMLCVLTLQFDALSFRSHADWLPMLSLLGLAILSVVAVTGYNWLIARWGAVRASSCTYVVPLVALLWGYAQAEPLGWHVTLACALVAGAMWAVR